MRSHCSVEGCRSGSAMDRHRERHHGLRRKSLFRFPTKDTQQRKLWEKFVGHSAIDNEVLCELHFRAEDVRKDYQIVLPDGEKFAMDRGRTSLRRGAVPLYRDCSHLVEEENVPAVQESVHDTTEDFEDYDVSQHSNLEISETAEISTPLRDSPDSTVNHNDVYYCSKIDEDVSPGSPTSRCSSPEITLEIKLEPFSPVAPETIGVEMDESAAATIGNSHENSVKTENSVSTLQSLHDELNSTTLSGGWSHFMPNSNFLIVAHWSASGGPARKEIHIYDDSSVQVFFDKRAVSVDGILPGITATNVLNNIKILRPLLLCDGTGLNDQRSPMCPGYVRPIMAYIKYGQVRCSECLRMRKATVEKQSKVNEKISKLNDKTQKLQKEKKSVKQSCQRLMAEVGRLKEEVKRWKEACGRAQEKAAAKEMATLCSE